MSSKRKLCVHPKAHLGALPAKSLILRSFQAEARKRDGVFADAVAAQDKSRNRTSPRKSTILGMALGCDETHKMLKAGLMGTARTGLLVGPLGAGPPASGSESRATARGSFAEN